MMKPHLINEYEEGDEIKVRYDGKTRFYTIDSVKKKKVIFKDGTEFVINKQSRTNGTIKPTESSNFSSSVLAGATIVPELY